MYEELINRVFPVSRVKEKKFTFSKLCRVLCVLDKVLNDINARSFRHTLMSDLLEAPLRIDFHLRLEWVGYGQQSQLFAHETLLGVGSPLNTMAEDERKEQCDNRNVRKTKKW